MDIDPKKIIEIGSGVVESVGLIKKAKALFSGSKPQARRRGDWDSARDKDRRISSIDRRLKFGIWLQFHRQTGLGQGEMLALPHRQDLVDAFVTEGVNYVFLMKETDTILMPCSIADDAADCAWRKFSEVPLSERVAMGLTDAMANHILSKYVVRRNDRRRMKPAQAAAV